MPSHASLFFSERPYQLKNYNNGQILYNKRNIPSLAALFEKNAFDTAAFVSLGVVRATFGLNKGFQTYGDQFPADRWYLSAEEVNRRVLPWLEAHRNRPFFLWVHYSDPHEPYILPGATDGMDRNFGQRLAPRLLLLEQIYDQQGRDSPPARGMNEIRFDFKNKFEDAFPYQARLDLFQLEAPKTRNRTENRTLPGCLFPTKRTERIFSRIKSMSSSHTGNAAPARHHLPWEADPSHRNHTGATIGGKSNTWTEKSDGFGTSSKSLGSMSNTAIVAVGDHGEGLGEYLTDDLSATSGTSISSRIST